jgi:hypothetical protein
MTFYISATRVHCPRRVRDLAADEGFILWLAGADRDVGLAFGQIEKPVADHQLNPQAGMERVKGVDEGCPLEAARQHRSAGHANGAGETFVACGEVALEGRHRCLDALGGGSQFLSKLG